MREIVIPLATGLAIFLFGMQVLRLGLARLTGNRLQKWLYQFTQTPFIGFLTGLVATVVLQSSSAVTVIIIGFINTKVMRFSQTIGLLLGTNVGTCVTTELLAVSIEKHALFLLLTGVACLVLPWANLRFIGLAVAGLGCIFLGMQAMASVAGSFERIGFFDFVSTSNSTLAGVLIGTLFSAVIQSSSATIALMMGLYHAHAVTLPFALAVVLGSNVGTCVTAWIAAVGGDREGKQIALAHLLINAVGLLAFYPLTPYIADWLGGTTLTRYAQVAHFQTGFNAISALLLLPFSHALARFVGRLLPTSS
ncbi:Na/Pi cotransporter family protein [Numidum massiliense]|uniref:Na/Pi cotransporter family protein n=1 Tax=Numidum massiliense TaxID=1522315 RepID=UPI0006D539FE|nr:Na/Pi symporter [Numidum massiliense]